MSLETRECPSRPSPPLGTRTSDPPNHNIALQVPGVCLPSNTEQLQKDRKYKGERKEGRSCAYYYVVQLLVLVVYSTELGTGHVQRPLQQGTL